jgi:hypothetical protein
LQDSDSQSSTQQEEIILQRAPALAHKEDIAENELHPVAQYQNDGQHRAVINHEVIETQAESGALVRASVKGLLRVSTYKRENSLI